MKHFFDNLSRVGTKYNLSFTAQEIIHDGILGFDGIRRKLVILCGMNSGRLTDYVIDIDQVKGCSLKKDYGKIEANGLKQRSLDQYLKRISLLVDVAKGSRKEILFYERTEHSDTNANAVELKARRWKTILSKLKKPARKRPVDSIIIHDRRQG